METQILPASQIPEALEILLRGGIVAFPTDTVYGLGCLAFNNLAIESIYHAKQRPAEKAIPILIADPDDLEQVAIQIPAVARRLAAHFWPGALTCVLPKHPDLPPAISESATVAIRVPNHPDARALLRAAGPMAVTSANISGSPSPTTAREVYEQLAGRIPLILDGGVCPGGLPSTLVDCTTNQPKILREGPISWTELSSVLERK